MHLRQALALALALVPVAAATACGDDNDTGAPTRTLAGDASADVAGSNAAVDDSESGDPTSAASAPAATRGAMSTDAGGGGDGDASSCRTVAHELGEACVPEAPERIVAIDPVGALPTLLDLGAPVVGAASVYGDVFPDYIDESELEGVETVGGSQSLNVEQVATIRPDLIVGSIAYIGDHYDALSELAPTVVTLDTYYNDDWQETLLAIAGLVGGRDELLAQLDDIDATAAQLAAQLADAGDPPEVTRMDLYQDSPFVFRHGCVWWGSLLEAAGVTQPEAQQGPCTEGEIANGYVQVSPEELEIVDGDLILVYDFQGDETVDAVTAVHELLGDNPLWERLGAVQRGDVVAVDDAWGLGAGARAAEQILDDLEQVLLTT